MTCLAVLGVGRVGGEVAYLASALRLADELILYDAYTPLLEAQILDLEHMGSAPPIETDPRLVRKKADICVFAAGLPRNQSVKTRADLLDQNLPVATECGGALKGFSGVLITVTNPMDPNNYFISRKVGLEPERCIGFGGQLDSARFTFELSKDGGNKEAWVIGEHGEHQVPVFSRLDAGVQAARREEILANLRNASMEIIKGKGGTVFGPAWHISQLIRAIARDTRELVSCSCVLSGEWGLTDCSIGVPARVGRDGIYEIEEWKLDPWEQQKFDEAGAFVQELCRRAYLE
ncbi:MAG: lactate dehydrogenase [Methanoregulaceae archaeon]|nr:lactate dehydrogenase [Methanoregulaceae archaeon]